MTQPPLPPNVPRLLLVLWCLAGCARSPWADQPSDCATPQAWAVTPDTAPVLVGGLESIYRHLRYPKEVWDAGIEGEVMLEFTVSRRGRVLEPRVLASPHASLSRAALSAIRHADFDPAMKDGTPVCSRFRLPLWFQK